MAGKWASKRQAIKSPVDYFPNGEQEQLSLVALVNGKGFCRPTRQRKKRQAYVAGGGGGGETIVLAKLIGCGFSFLTVDLEITRALVVYKTAEIYRILGQNPKKPVKFC